MKQEQMVLILDAQGGGLGAQLVKRLLPLLPEGYSLLCVGTNAAATGAMLKAGCPTGATGENAIIYNAGRAALILGPIGMIVANGIQGEVSPAMATAVSGAAAKKILIPSNHCGVAIAGVEGRRMEECLTQAVQLAQKEFEA